MNPRYRTLVRVLCVLLTSLTLLGSCETSPTLIFGSVSFLNPPLNYRSFPNTLHVGPSYADDVCYVRLVDTGGAGTVLWESGPLKASVVGNYVDKPTPPDGVYVARFRIFPTDAVLAAAVPPLRLEAFLYDSAVAAPIDPATDVERFTAYDLNGEGPPGWYSSLTISPDEIKAVDLDTPLPFAP